MADSVQVKAAKQGLLALMMLEKVHINYSKFKCWLVNL